MKLTSPSLDFVLWGEGGERGAFVLRQNCSRGKLICCFVLELVYLTFITAATYLFLKVIFQLTSGKFQNFKIQFQFSSSF